MNRAKIRILSINLVLVILVASAGYWGWSAIHPKAAAAVTSTTTVSLGDVSSTVSASGKVISPGDIGVSPSVNAVIKSISVKVGDHVKVGEVLAQLDPTAQQISLQQANNSLLSAKNALAKLTPTRTAQQQVQVDLQLQQSKNSVDVASQNLATAQAATNTNAATYQASVDSAKTALANAQDLSTTNPATYQASVDNAAAALANAQDSAAANVAVYQASVDSAKKALDSAQINYDNYYNTWSPYGLTVTYCQNLNFNGLAGSVTANDAFSHCSTILGNLNSLTNAQASYSNSLATQSANLKKDAQNIASLKSALASAQLSQTVNLKKDAQNLASLQNAYNQALTNQTTNLAKDATASAQTIQSDKNALKNAQLSYQLLQTQLAIAVAKPAQADVDAAQASITLAQANYSQAVRNLAATTIKAPVAGDVASIAAVVGQNAPTASSSAASASGSASGFIVLTNVSALRIQAGFSESDTAKIQAGQLATFAFAALPTLAPTGTVASVDLLPSTSSGATSYTVTFDLDSEVPGLKPGMSATVTVTTGSAINVLQVAAQAVTLRGTRGSVNVVSSVGGKEVLTRTSVVIGLQGDSTDQILSGLKEGQKIALRTTTTSVGSNGFPTGGIPAVTGAGGTLTGGGGFGGGGRGGGG
ncbi:MAG: biotin/lipoyl-binding protein [Actinomycetes bacterium]